jgi:hypothetical protein
MDVYAGQPRGIVCATRPPQGPYALRDGGDAEGRPRPQSGGARAPTGPRNVAVVDRATDKAPMLFLHGEAPCDVRFDIGSPGALYAFDSIMAGNRAAHLDAVGKYFASCLGRGPRIGGDDKAWADAIEQVHRFVTATPHAR